MEIKGIDVSAWQGQIDWPTVGYLLNVHEGPNSFRWKNLPGGSEGQPDHRG